MGNISNTILGTFATFYIITNTGHKYSTYKYLSTEASHDTM